MSPIVIFSFQNMNWISILIAVVYCFPIAKSLRDDNLSALLGWVIAMAMTTVAFVR